MPFLFISATFRIEFINVIAQPRKQARRGEHDDAADNVVLARVMLVTILHVRIAWSNWTLAASVQVRP